MTADKKSGTSCNGDLCVSDGSHCGTPDPRGVYVCTRKHGHAGPHIACSGSQHNLKTWTVLPARGKSRHAPVTPGD